MKVYEIITDQIIKKLEDGIIPWKKPWKNASPMNFVTKKAYRGINVLLLGLTEFNSPYWLSFKQANKLGGRIKAGAKSTIIVYWKIMEEKIEETDNEGNKKTRVKRIPLLRYYRVFNMEQTEGIKYETESREVNTIKEAEDIVEKYNDKPEIRHGGDRACYSPDTDKINMPLKENFESDEYYYTTLFHELIHSTGHEDRLDRKTVTDSDGFGNKEYSKEELVAEIGACFLNSICKIEEKTFNNNTAYIQGWLKALNNDKKMIVFASAQAQKAVDYMTGKIEKKAKKEETVTA